MMNDPSRPPIAPIASPDSFNPLPPVASGGGDWKSAPLVVRGWAYPLTWLGIIILPFIILGAMFSVSNGNSSRLGMGIFYAVLLGFTIWLNRGLRRGTNAAWAGQIALSCFGLLGFPLGTAINVYILSQWFKPATKAWFNQS